MYYIILIISLTVNSVYSSGTDEDITARDYVHQYRLGNLHIVSGDRETGVKYLRLSAYQGYAPALFSLGIVEADNKNDSEAVRLYKEAVLQGYAKAQYNLGFCYETERGLSAEDLALSKVELDKIAFKYFFLAAQQGLKEAQIKISYFYNIGKGVEKSKEESLKWFQVADQNEGPQDEDNVKVVDNSVTRDFGGVINCDDVNNPRNTEEKLLDLANLAEKLLTSAEPRDKEQGLRLMKSLVVKKFAPAQYKLGLFYTHSEAEGNNDVDLFKLAAEQGYAKAEFILANKYLLGKGVDADLHKARVLFALAASKGVEDAKTMLDHLDKSVVDHFVTRGAEEKIEDQNQSDDYIFSVVYGAQNGKNNFQLERLLEEADENYGSLRTLSELLLADAQYVTVMVLPRPKKIVIA